MSALVFAREVAPPIAMDTSAADSAGASLIPSPTINTTAPRSLERPHPFYFLRRRHTSRVIFLFPPVSPGAAQLAHHPPLGNHIFSSRFFNVLRSIQSASGRGSSLNINIAINCFDVAKATTVTPSDKSVSCKSGGTFCCVFLFNKLKISYYIFLAVYRRAHTPPPGSFLIPSRQPIHVSSQLQ